jgi:hypothetical protein
VPEYQYRKSTYSDPEAECVEIATNIPTTIAIRDSKNPTGPRPSASTPPPGRPSKLPCSPSS